MTTKLPAILVMVLGLCATACSLTASEMSCTLKNAQTGQPERCIEYRDFSAAASLNAKASLNLLCEAFNADVDDKACAITGALVGCEQNYQDAWIQTEWFWATGDKPTAGSFSCDSKDKRLGPDRQPIGMNTGNGDMGSSGGDMSSSSCTPSTSSAAVTINFQNNTADTVTTYWVNQACTEIRYSSIAAGMSKAQQTFAFHPWRVREGENNANGTVLKEFAAQPGDAPMVTVSIP